MSYDDTEEQPFTMEAEIKMITTQARVMTNLSSPKLLTKTIYQ